MTQEYWMYFKENWQSMAEKDPPIGRIDNFQTGPKGKSTQRRQLDAMLDGLSEDGIRIVTATGREIVQIEQAKQHKTEDA